MSKTVILESDNPKSIDLLIKVAKEMGISVRVENPDDDGDKLRLKMGKNDLKKDWSDPANAHWDDFFKKALSV